MAENNWKYNKGEWSEAYVFLKVLTEGKLYSADQNLERIEEQYYPIVKILREESFGKRDYKYDININVIDGKTRKILQVIPIKEFELNSNHLLKKIKAATDTTFYVPKIEKFLNSIDVEKIKSESKKTRDITIVIHDIHTGFKPIVGFSIKSFLGQHPTLVNASGQTNFLYKITGITLSEEEIEELNILSVKKKLKKIKELNGNLVFSKLQSEIFKLNLELIDSQLPNIISEMLVYYYSQEASTVNELVSLLKQQNPCNFNLEFDHPFYENKVKCFLTEKALGLMPGKIWKGIYDATGGFIAVKKDGDVVCYHIYNKKEFQNYLFNHTKFESPASHKRQTNKQKERGDKRRFLYGDIRLINDELVINLNLQIRFK